ADRTGVGLAHDVLIRLDSRRLPCETCSQGRRLIFMMFGFALVFAGMFPAQGVAAGGRMETPPTLPDTLRLELVVPSPRATGPSVTFSLRLTNLPDPPLTLYLRGRRVAFDLTVKDQTGAVVWRRLRGAVVPAILRVERLAAGATLSLHHRWNQKSDEGQ